MKRLNIKYADLFNNEKKLEYLFERNRGSPRKVKEVYRRLLKLSRKKISLLLELLGELEDMLSIDVEKLEKDFNETLKLIGNVAIRKIIEKDTGIRSDRLTEYFKHKRKPSIRTLLKLLKCMKTIKVIDNEIYSNLLRLYRMVNVIRKCKLILGISFTEIEKEVGAKGASVAYRARNSTLSMNSIRENLNVVMAMKKAVESVIHDRLLIDFLELIDFLQKSQIFWDEVKEVSKVGETMTYDIEIEGSHNFIGGEGFFVLHNTTCALVIARELYGDSWRRNILSMNASDARGIDVIRHQVKEFARMKAIGDVPFKIILLDECDSMTPDAQQALRRIMEDYSNITRFILIANYSSKIIDPIQSRCAVFRFKAHTEEAMRKFIERIAEKEKLKITEDGIKAIMDIAEGDLRRVANLMQAASALTKNIDEEIVYEVASLAKPKDIKEMLNLALNGKFKEARQKLFDMIIKQGLAGEDIVKQIHKEIYKLDIPDDAKIKLIEKTGECEFRISEGGDPLIQLEALLAQFLLASKR
ncbi:MAG TPA: replication factor C small subunit [Candidatus Aenigmarchaeota archaeon]|nr:replication factor C small subunit [Candidatus Aenigmarchaeota archaeon]